MLPLETSVTASAPGFRRSAALLGVGFLVTGLGQPLSLGGLPLNIYLKEHLHFLPPAVALFGLLGGAPYYFKPLAGMLADGLPLWGTRRRGALLLCGALAMLLWLLLALLPHRYVFLLGLTISLSAVVMTASAIFGGFLVEQSARYAAAGRLSSLRVVVEGVGSLAGSLLGGRLAAHDLGWTAAVNMGLFAAMIVAVWHLLPERVAAKRADWRVTQTEWRGQMASLRNAPALWAVAFGLFLVRLAPGFGTPLLYIQLDRLHFTKPFIGVLGAVFAGCGGAAAFAFFALCKRLPLRTLIAGGVAGHVLTTLLYLGYNSPVTALTISALSGLSDALAVVAILSAAARATPTACAALGYGIVASLYRVAYGISDVLGSWLYGTRHLPFTDLVWLNAGTTLLALPILFLLPRSLLAGRDGESIGQESEGLKTPR